MEGAPTAVDAWFRGRELDDARLGGKELDDAWFRGRELVETVRVGFLCKARDQLALDVCLSPDSIVWLWSPSDCDDSNSSGR